MKFDPGPVVVEFSLVFEVDVVFQGGDCTGGGDVVGQGLPEPQVWHKYKGRGGYLLRTRGMSVGQVREDCCNGLGQGVVRYVFLGEAQLEAVDLCVDVLDGLLDQQRIQRVVRVAHSHELASLRVRVRSHVTSPLGLGLARCRCPSHHPERIVIH